MKAIKGGFIALGILTLAVTLHAQSLDTPPPDSIVQLTAETYGLELLSPESLPRYGTFWVVSSNGFTAPYPCLPNDTSPLVYPIADNQFLVDETGGQVAVNTRKAATNTVAAALEMLAGSVASLISQIQETQLVQEMAMFFGFDEMESESEGGMSSPMAFSMSVADYGTNLWITQVQVTNSFLAGIGTNTEADISYEIQSRTNLLQSDWQSEGFILGSELTNWTPLSVAQNGRTNLFIRLRSWADDGSGLPLWWQDMYFSTNGVDPYGDPDGDGWNNLQEFQNGTNPNSFNTPPAPQMRASLNANTILATVSWLPSPGPVTGYTLQKIDQQTDQTNYFTLAAGTQSFEDDLSSDPDDFYGSPQLRVYYSLQAHYASGNSAWGSVALNSIPGPSANLVNGPQGRLHYAMPGLPGDLSKVRFFRYWWYPVFNAVYEYWEQDLISNYPSPLGDGYFEIPVAQMSNGVFMLSDSQSSPFFLNDFWIQTVLSNGLASAWSVSSGRAASEPFVDARSQMKDNLRFVLRAATELGPFAFGVIDRVHNQPTNCAYAGFYSGDFDSFDALRPIHDNCFYRNFVFDENNLAPDGFLNTGCFYGGDNIGYNYSSFLFCTNYPTYYFDPSDFLIATNPTVPSSLLTADQTMWILPMLDTEYGNVAPGDRNYYGLPYLSVKDAYVTNSALQWGTYNPGDSVPDGFCYRRTAQPGFQTDSYYFVRVGVDLRPEQDGFSPTSTTQPIIAGINDNPYQHLTIAGYAKLAVTNGYSGVFGYLGQYFDQAYQINGNGTVTTNTTGVLSPYGDFLPTEPGGAALVTMPDIDTGERGTCVVHTVSLQLDANHDGSMTLPFSSPDATTPANPMVVWVNDNYDRGHTVDVTDFEQDDLGPVDIAKGHLVPDCQYVTNGLPAIPCTRDLEDYFRLWAPGLSAAMSAAPTNYTVELSMWGDGQIRIFQAVEPDGGTNYLFGEITASNQVASSTNRYIGLLTSGSPIVLNNKTNEHFIFCGAQTGSANLELRILDGDQNIVAYTPAFLQIKDIKQMYERWTVGDDPKVAPKSAPVLDSSDLTNPPAPAFQYTLPTGANTPYILLVHGWNMERWEKDRFAETAFKRLYWQGYQGRFGIFRWPTGNKFDGGFSDVLTDSRNYDNSEFTAWQSATGLTNLLTQLNAEYPNNVYLMAHSMGNIVAGEALRRADSQLVNTYVAMQGAVPSHTYDATATSRSIVAVLGLGGDDGTPNRYANYYTNGAPSYFNASAGAGVYVNFYNTNDYALDKWTIDQNFKPDAGVTFPGYHYSSSSGFYKIIGAGTNSTTYLSFPGDTYEIFAYGDEARSFALGAQPNVGGVFKPGLSYQQIDLRQSPYGFDREHKYHSGQFRSDNISRAVFWDILLKQMSLKL
jgi:hypothetical protein